MSILHTLPQQIAGIMSPITVNGQVVAPPLNTPADVKNFLARITQVEKNLRLLKTEINDEMRLVSEQYTERSAHVHHNPVVGGVFGREEMKHLSAHEREHIHHQQVQALEPYHQAIMHLDQRIAILDNLKFQVNSAAQQTNFQPGPPPPPPVYTHTCHFCGYQFGGPNWPVPCPKCGGVV